MNSIYRGAYASISGIVAMILVIPNRTPACLKQIYRGAYASISGIVAMILVIPNRTPAVLKQIYIEELT